MPKPNSGNVGTGVAGAAGAIGGNCLRYLPSQCGRYVSDTGVGIESVTHRHATRRCLLARLA